MASTLGNSDEEGVMKRTDLFLISNICKSCFSKGAIDEVETLEQKCKTLIELNIKDNETFQELLDGRIDEEQWKNALGVFDGLALVCHDCPRDGPRVSDRIESFFISPYRAELDQLESDRKKSGIINRVGEEAEQKRTVLVDARKKFRKGNK